MVSGTHLAGPIVAGFVARFLQTSDIIRATISASFSLMWARGKFIAQGNLDRRYPVADRPDFGRMVPLAEERRLWAECSSAPGRQLLDHRCGRRCAALAVDAACLAAGNP
ncbi:hypothetical protein MPLSOD_40563 [Mesorhizobium sp. SOD10]|nr:hypothetical protein MPLSOD_40563 [Mesorhizobium sp. SOD10]